MSLVVGRITFWSLDCGEKPRDFKQESIFDFLLSVVDM